MISQYVYISTAQGLSREEVEAILAVCARNNVAQKVTGLLLYNGRNFLQLLEGAKDTLDRLMQNIEADPRHAGVAILHKGEVDDRVCPDWAMKRIAITEAIEQRQQRLEEELPNLINPAIRKVVLNFAMLN
ncbi:BLUF domain-containing protein [uncultured Erythrobacter sp.]|uniref:BLUF domain-containing protein n=1 Tax=uncultured Erythrobacter sp. TaxID=263913 RepID=UPI00261E0AE1|nr:BLUF domain-containing protein [uncultured Erythrobacter sp.]